MGVFSFLNEDNSSILYGKYLIGGLNNDMLIDPIQSSYNFITKHNDSLESTILKLEEQLN